MKLGEQSGLAGLAKSHIYQLLGALYCIVLTNGLKLEFDGFPEVIRIVKYPMIKEHAILGKAML